MKRKTPLKRYTALKRSGFRRSKTPKDHKTAFRRQKPLKRKPLKKISASKAKKLRNEYFPALKEWLTRPENQFCAICLTLGLTPNVATENHHRRGRAGRLLMDQRFWTPCCRSHREWPHENPRQARELGLLAEVGEWNVSPRD